MRRKQRGSITVEAAIILPLFIMVILFIVNFLNIFSTHLIVQQGLTNTARVISQYCYAVDITLGIENLSLQNSTAQTALNLADALGDFQGATIGAMEAINGGFKLSNLGNILDKGESFVSASSQLAGRLKGVRGEDIANFLFSTAAEVGGGMLVEAMVESYLKDMQVNRNLIDGDIHYTLYLESGTKDLVLTAYYTYRHPLLSVFIDSIAMKQTVVVHPWVGGSTPGLKNS